MSKIKVDEFNRVCRLANLIQIMNSVTYPTWKNKMNTEGLELKNDKILTFHFINGQRLYEQPIDDKNILAVVGAFEEKPEVVKEEKVLSKDPVKIDPSQDLNGLMPDVLTKSLYEKWQKMSIAEKLIMLQITDKRYIKERKGRGGKYPYVDGHYMVLCANMAFGFSWSCHVDSWIKTDDEIICLGYVETKIGNETIKKFAVGQKDLTFRQNTRDLICLGDDYKASEMDMLKKALSYFGIAKDVYSGDL